LGLHRLTCAKNKVFLILWHIVVTLLCPDHCACLDSIMQKFGSLEEALGALSVKGSMEDIGTEKNQYGRLVPGTRPEMNLLHVTRHDHLTIPPPDKPPQEPVRVDYISSSDHI
jgi:hypothetical protein